jgi:hypothetical protein
MFFDPLYLIILSPALVLGLWAQWRVRSSYHEAARVPAPLSGAAAARHVLRSAGLDGIAIEQVGGYLSDHYDPRHKVLRLSPDVYNGRSMAAVGIAAHEAGHALQDAQQYAPLAVRNAVVPVASFGSGISMLLIIAGFVFSQALVWVGIALFSTVVFFQLVNLPVEFNASGRAKRQLAELGIVDQQGMVYVNRVLSAAALTYVAATLQAILTLVYLVLRFSGSNRD